MYTQCPECQTLFRITHEQLHAAHGKVRCGHCHGVFYATAHLVAQLPTPATAETPPSHLAPADVATADLTRSTDDGPGAVDTPAQAAPEPPSSDEAAHELVAEQPQVEPSVESAETGPAIDAPMPSPEEPSPVHGDDDSDEPDFPDFAGSPLEVTELSFPEVSFQETPMAEAHEAVEGTAAEDDHEPAPIPAFHFSTGELDELLATQPSHIEPRFPHHAEDLLAATRPDPEDATPTGPKDGHDESPRVAEQAWEEDTPLPDTPAPTKTGLKKAARTEPATSAQADKAVATRKPMPAPHRLDLSEVHEVLLEDDHQGRRGNPLATLGWSVLVLALCATLAMQYAYQKRDTLARLPELRPYLETLCSWSGCRLPLRSALGAIELSERDIHSHERFDGALVISGTLVNQADFPQPYPRVEVIMRDLNGARVASRQFLPEEYLPASPGPAFAAHAVARLELEVLDPGSEAVSFEFAFHE